MKISVQCMAAGKKKKTNSMLGSLRKTGNTIAHIIFIYKSIMHLKHHTQFWLPYMEKDRTGKDLEEDKPNEQKAPTLFL